MKKRIFLIVLLLFITSFVFANNDRPRIFIGINGTGLNVIGLVFEYSFYNSFSIISEIHFMNPVDAPLGFNVFVRYYFLENMNKFYVDLGLGYFGNIARTNSLIINPRIGWRFSLETRFQDRYFVLEPHLGYPFIIPINNQWNLCCPPNNYSLLGIFGIITGINF